LPTLRQADDEAHRSRRLLAFVKEHNKDLRQENAELREKLCLLERLDLLKYNTQSSCMLEFRHVALKETY
jgi:hypothetical protein